MQAGLVEQRGQVALAGPGQAGLVERARVELGTACQNVDSGPRPPEWSQTLAATVPPGRVTRAISRSPATGSAMKCTTSCARARSNPSSSKGSASAAAGAYVETGQPLAHERHEDSEGSTAATASTPSSPTSGAVSAPGPQPTSSARCPGRGARRSTKRSARGAENRPMNRA